MGSAFITINFWGFFNGMVSNLLQYDQLIDTALKGVVKKALLQIAENGLPGAHHIYLTFATQHPEVEIPEFLEVKYPKQMTIVLQYQFWNLEVSDNNFSVSLSFNDKQERLNVPFAAVTAFADPSVNFELQMQPLSPNGSSYIPNSTTDNSSTEDTHVKADIIRTDVPSETDNNVVKLDVYRKD